MLKKIGRLFVIKTRWEAFLVIYALGLGAVERGSAYLEQFPGFGGKLLFLACTGSVFIAGAKILDCLRYEQAAANMPGRALNDDDVAEVETPGEKARA